MCKVFSLVCRVSGPPLSRVSRWTKRSSLPTASVQWRMSGWGMTTSTPPLARALVRAVVVGVLVVGFMFAHLLKGCVYGGGVQGMLGILCEDAVVVGLVWLIGVVGVGVAD
jgi:hypothetical protein